MRRVWSATALLLPAFVVCTASAATINVASFFLIGGALLSLGMLRRRVV